MDYFEPATDTPVTASSFTNGTYQKVMVTEMTGVIEAIPDRRLSKETCSKFGVRIEFDQKGNIAKHHYPFKDADTGETVCTKVRIVKDKQFMINGSTATIWACLVKILVEVEASS